MLPFKLLVGFEFFEYAVICSDHFKPEAVFFLIKATVVIPGVIYLAWHLGSLASSDCVEFYSFKVTFRLVYILFYFGETRILH